MIPPDNQNIFSVAIVFLSLKSAIETIKKQIDNRNHSFISYCSFDCIHRYRMKAIHRSVVYVVRRHTFHLIKHLFVAPAKVASSVKERKD